MLLRNGLFFADGHFGENLCVRVETGRVTAMGEDLAPLAGEAVIDLQGDFVLPGFVDAHIHAFRGHDTMQGEDAIRQMARELYQEGVAAFLPTTMSASVEDTRRVIAAVRRVMDTPEQRAARVLGAHMEAPFLSPEKAGAQRKEFFLHPNWEAFLDLTGGDIQAVRVITMAPELPGAEAFIRKAAENGIHVSIGHTAATDEQVHRAADWGATRVTHTYNAQTPFTHRAPGVPGAALTDDRLFAEFIGDGVHLHDDAVKVLLRCKGADKAVAITDSMEAAGLPDGEYALGGQAVTVRGHEARLHDGTLAGSVLLMRQAFQNLADTGSGCAHLHGESRAFDWRVRVRDDLRWGKRAPHKVGEGFRLEGNPWVKEILGFGILVFLFLAEFDWNRGNRLCGDEIPAKHAEIA